VFLDWDEEDQAKALAYQRWTAARCPQCGSFPDEWLDERGRLLIDPPYEAEIVSCNGCRAVAEVQEEAHRHDPDDKGLRVRLTVPRPRPEPSPL
jgi:hypothetical protein